MKKAIITILLIITCVMFVSPVNTMALENNNINIVENTSSNALTNTINIASGETILGDPTDEDSVAWLVYLVLNIIKIAGPILVILLSSVDFILVIVKSDNDAFAKAQKKLITRLVLAILLFLVPVVVQVILEVFGITGSTIPGL